MIHLTEMFQVGADVQYIYLKWLFVEALIMTLFTSLVSSMFSWKVRLITLNFSFMIYFQLMTDSRLLVYTVIVQRMSSARSWNLLLLGMNKVPCVLLMLIKLWCLRMILLNIICLVTSPLWNIKFNWIPFTLTTY